jgi:hypothetical protein
VIRAKERAFSRARQDVAHFKGNALIIAGMTRRENIYNLQYIPLMMTV